MLTVSPTVGHHSSTGVCLGGTPGSGGVSIGALVVGHTLPGEGEDAGLSLSCLAIVRDPLL